jgi:hypothetical protein
MVPGRMSSDGTGGEATCGASPPLGRGRQRPTEAALLPEPRRCRVCVRYAELLSRRVGWWPDAGHPKSGCRWESTTRPWRRLHPRIVRHAFRESAQRMREQAQQKAGVEGGSVALAR